MVKPKIQDFMSQIEHYRAVLDDLQRQRDLYRLKIAEVDQAISSLHRLIPAEAKQELPPQDHSIAPKATVPQGKYVGMGVRWAILSLLSEEATGPMTTGEIAAALKEGGVQSEAAKFAGNVSAVLSVMSRQKEEVTSSENGWVISTIGRSAWAHIRSKREAQSQFPTSSNVQ